MVLNMKKEAVASNAVELSVTSEYDSYSLEAQNSVYLNVNLKAPECLEVARQPVDLVVVLDRSGSMGGPKLELCKKTVAFLIQELSCNDRFSLITYDTTVRTDLPLTKMTTEGKSAVETALRKVKAGSSTNLSGGLLAAIQEIQQPTRKDQLDPNPVRSILLLTDGLANHGLTDTNSLVSLLEGSLDPNVSLFTFGYGAGHNAEMLREISQVGRGVYYFVETVDGVTLAFADCLGGLLSVVAQSIKLEIEALGNSNILSIKTRKRVTTLLPSKRFAIDMGDLYGEEQRDLLIQVALPAIDSGTNTFSALECSLQYANVLNNCLDKKQAQATLVRVKSLELADRVPNSALSQQKNRILAAEAMERSNVLAQKGQLQEGRVELEKAMAKISENLGALSVEDAESTGTLVADLHDCKSQMENAHVYNSKGAFTIASKGQSHWTQRSNDVSVCCLSESAAAPEGAMPPAPTSTYATKGKNAMRGKSMFHKFQ